MSKTDPDTMIFQTGAQAVVRWARETPNAVAVVNGDYRYTYAGMAVLIVKTIKYFQSSGMPSNSLIGIECGNPYTHLVFVLACECLGNTTASLRPSELTLDDRVLAHCAALLLETAGPATGDWPLVLPITNAVLAAISATPITRDDLAALVFQPEPHSGGRIVRTSGTTGREKCMCNDSLSIQRALWVTEYMLDQHGSGSDNFVCLYQFNFRPSYTGSVLALRSGKTILFTSPADFLRDIAAIKHSQTVLLPHEAAALTTAFTGPRDPATRCCVQINGGSLHPALRRDLLASFATSVFNTYSINETNYVAVVDPDGAGTLLPGAEIRIVGEQGQDLPLGETGQIMVRSPRMVPGYLWDDALTARKFLDGWHVTGDLGYCPDDSHLVVLGRADDMLNIGGVKLPPQPIEAMIRTIPGVRDAVLVAIDGSQGIGELHLVVERLDPRLDQDLDRRIRPIVQSCGRDFTAHYRTSLPRTETGKVQRAAVKKRIQDGWDE